MQGVSRVRSDYGSNKCNLRTLSGRRWERKFVRKCDRGLGQVAATLFRVDRVTFWARDYGFRIYTTRGLAPITARENRTRIFPLLDSSFLLSQCSEPHRLLLWQLNTTLLQSVCQSRRYASA